MPRAYEDEGAYEGKKWYKGGLQRGKMRKKWPTKAKMKEIDPQKKFYSSNIKKIPRAYESLNPALVLALQNWKVEKKEKTWNISTRLSVSKWTWMAISPFSLSEKNRSKISNSVITIMVIKNILGYNEHNL